MRLSLFLIGPLAICLAGCGGSSTPPNNDTCCAGRFFAFCHAVVADTGSRHDWDGALPAGDGDEWLRFSGDGGYQRAACERDGEPGIADADSGNAHRT